MDTKNFTAPEPYPSTDSEAERPCACYGGWVFVGYTDEYGEERGASYPCRRCSEARFPAGETS